MPFCPDCGIVVSGDYQFCPECGRPLATEEVVVGGPVEGKSKKKIAGIIVACVIAIVVIIVLFSTKPWERTYTLSVSVYPSQAGFVLPSGGEYKSGDQVTLTAIPNTGYTFDHWSGTTSATTSTVSITMDSHESLIAHFETIPTTPEVLFSDDFSDESSGWVTYDEYDGRVIYQNGYLCIKDYTTHEGTMYSESQRYLTDFILEVETWLVSGTDTNWHGVSCRYKDDDNYYGFAIGADGYYTILKWVNGDETVFIAPTYSSYINQGVGAVNLIHIECIGSNLGLSVNGHLLWEGTDTSLTGGDITLAANSQAGTFTEVAFDNIVVSEPSVTIPTAHGVLFSDDFSDESSGWVTFDDADGRVAYVNECFYIKDYTYPEAANYGNCQRYFTDFVLEVETWLVGGTDNNWHSAICRLQDNDNYYDFGISADGYYDILKFDNENRISLVPPTYTSYINQGVDAVNIIYIECIGNTLSLSVNEHELANVTDNTFSGGDIALAANAIDGTFTEVAFDNIVISEP